MSPNGAFSMSVLNTNGEDAGIAITPMSNWKRTTLRFSVPRAGVETAGASLVVATYISY